MNSETASETANTDADADAPADDQTPSADEYTQENDNEGGSEEGGEENLEEGGNATMSNAAPSADTGVVAGDGATPAASPPPRLAPVESMEVRIDFEVGRVTLPVSSLANVATGSVIEMPGVSLDRVVAKSGGQAFAFGEFVELGGRVGFRILSLKETKEKS